MRRIAFPGLCLVVVATLAGPAEAQVPVASEPSGILTSARSGLWLTLGLAGGSSRLSCDICIGERRSGPSGFLGVGLTLNQRALVGLEADAWAKLGDDVDQYVASVGAVATLYPRPGSGLHLKGGPSVVLYRATDDDDNQVDATTFGFQLGVGYEIPLGPSYGLSPYVNVIASSFGGLRADDRSIPGGAAVTLVQLGFAFMVH